MLEVSTATLYRAPFPGARRRLSLRSACRDWAWRIIAAKHPCDCGGDYSYWGPGPYLCERHGDDERWRRVHARLARMLESRARRAG